MKILDKFLKGGKVQDDKLPRDDKGNVVYGPAGDADPDQLTFSEAFADAKRAGAKRFKWKGKWYTTETKDEQNKKTMEKMKKVWEDSSSFDADGKPIPRKKYPKKPKVTRKYEEGGKTEKPKTEKPKPEPKPEPKKEKKDKPTANKKSDNGPTQKKEKRTPFFDRTQHNTEIKTADDKGRSDAYFYVDEEGNKTHQRTTTQKERQRAEDKRKIKKDDKDYVSSSGKVDIHSIPDKRDAQFEADERSYKTQRKERRKERDAKSEWTGSGKPRQLDLEDKEGRNKYEQRIDREILGDQGAKSSYVGPTRGQDDTKYAVTDHQRKFDNNIFGRRNIETNRKTKGTYKVQDVDATGDNRVREYGDTVQIKEGHGKTEKFKVKKKGPKRGHIDGIKYKTRKTRRNEQQYLGQDEDGNWIKNPKYNKRKKVTKSGFWGLNRKKEWVDDEDFIKPNENLVASKDGSIVMGRGVAGELAKGKKSNKGSIVRRYMGGGHVAQGGSTKAMMSKGGKVRKGKKKGMAVIIAIGKPKVNRKGKKGHSCG